MGKEDEFEGLIIRSQSILPPKGASEIEIKTQQVPELFSLSLKTCLAALAWKTAINTNGVSFKVGWGRGTLEGLRGLSKQRRSNPQMSPSRESRFSLFSFSSDSYATS